MSHHRAWFFDAVGTLIHPEPSPAVVYAEVGQRHGSRLTLDRIATRFREAFRAEEDADREAEWRTSEVRELERWRRIVGAVLDDVADLESCFQELWQHFARPQAWRSDPDVAAVLSVAGSRVLGVASNFDGRLHTLVEGLPELRPLRHVLVSSEVGWRKPARPFFDAVVRASGLLPEEVLFIGDDPSNDHEGARAAGLGSVLYDPAGCHQNVAGIRLRCLRELLE